ncbi:MAG TPA: hypothetical protein ENJ52_13395, partial [Aliiroseovarius sp.]|nr:hypothetical protein [Aliiroseovarius sp.]
MVSQDVCMIFGIVSTLTRTWKRRILLMLDAVNGLLAFYLAWALLVGRVPAPAEVLDAIRFPMALLPATIALTMALGLHRVKLNAYELHSMIGTTAVAVSLGLVGALVNLLPGPALPEATFVVLSMAFAILSVGLRLVLRWFVHQMYLRNTE